MKKVISFLKNLRLRQIMTVFLAGLTVFVMQAFGNILPAQADETVKSPYGYYYKGTPDENVAKGDRNFPSNDNQMGENVKNNLKSTVDNVREKLNLDEPVPQSTKDFLQSTKERVGEAVESLTGSQNQQEYQNPGYYQKSLEK